VNARNEKQKQQNQAAAHASAKGSREHYAKMAQTNWFPSPSNNTRSRSDRNVYPSGGGTKKKGGGGVALLVIFVIGIIIYANSGSNKSTNTGETYSAPVSGPTPEVAPQPAPEPPPSVPTASPVETQPSQPVAASPIQPAQAPIQQAQPDPQAQAPQEVAPTPEPVPPPALQVVSKIAPQYPALARQSGFRGTIVVNVGVSQSACRDS